MRVLRLVAVVCLFAASTLFVQPEASAQGTWGERLQLDAGEPPSTANPYLAFLPGSNGDFDGWNEFARVASPARVKQQGHPPRGPRSSQVNERPGNNDRPQGAQRIFLDTRRGNGSASIDVIGRGPTQPVGNVTDLGGLQEPDDSYGDATAVVTALAAGDSVTATGAIAPEAGNPFDFDALALQLTGGTQLVVDIDTSAAPGLNSYLTLWDAVTPFPIAENGDDGETQDSRLVFNVPTDGTYYVFVAGFGAFGPANPNDPNSPSVTGAPGSVGEYAISAAARLVESDWYKVDLRQGDVFGSALFDGAGRVELYGPTGELLIGSGQDISFVHPLESPLPGGGNAAASYVISEAGRHTIKVDTADDYVAQFRGFRPLGDSEGRQTQVLYLDFDGATVDPGIFGGGAPLGFEVPLSPLSSFLPAWGLTPADEDAVIDAIVAEVIENVDTDLAEVGLNNAFDIEIRNSRDHADPWGQPLVSRIIIGGTVNELGIPTVGIAQSIDVGNFDAEESAVVLLDLLSGTGPFPSPAVNLNTYPLDPSVTIVDLIGRGAGAIAAHEAGHFFANWHTDQFNENANIMDQGGNITFTILGLGPDGVFGSADDVDVDFVTDTYAPVEGFAGTEDTLNSIAFGLWFTPNG